MRRGSIAGSLSQSGDGVILNPGSASNSPRHLEGAVYCLEEFGKIVSQILPVLWEIQTVLEKSPAAEHEKASTLDMLDLGEHVLTIQSHLIQSLVRTDNLATNDQLIAKAKLIFTCERLLSDCLLLPPMAEQHDSDYMSKAAIMLKTSNNLRDARTQLPIAEVVNVRSDAQIFIGNLNAFNIPTRRGSLVEANNVYRKGFETEVDRIVKQILLFHPEYAAMKQLEQDYTKHYAKMESQIKSVRSGVKGQKENCLAATISAWEDMLTHMKDDFRVKQGYRFKTIEAYTAWVLEDTLLLTIVNLEQECVRVLIGMQAVIGHLIQNYIPVLMSTYREAKIDCTALNDLLNRQTNHWRNSGFTDMHKMLLDGIFHDSSRKTHVIENDLIAEKLWVWVTQTLGKQLHLALTGVASALSAYPENCQSTPISQCMINFLSICHRLKFHVNALTELMKPDQSKSQSGFFFACTEIAKLGKKLIAHKSGQPDTERPVVVPEVAIDLPLPSPRNQEGPVSLTSSGSATPNFTQLLSPIHSQTGSPRESPPPGVTQPASLVTAVLTVERQSLQPQLRAPKKNSDATLRKSLQRQLKTRGANPSPPPHNLDGEEIKTKAVRSKSLTTFFPEQETDPLPAIQPMQRIDPDILRRALREVEEEDQQSEQSKLL